MKKWKCWQKQQHQDNLPPQDSAVFSRGTTQGLSSCHGMLPWLCQLVEHHGQKKAVNRRIQYPSIANDGILDSLDYL